MIYAIDNGLGLVKIGYSKNPLKRLGQIQIGSHGKCTLLGVIAGDLYREAELQRALLGSHERGEWFRKTDQVMGVVATMAPYYKEIKAGHPLRVFRKKTAVTLKAFAAQVGVVPSHISQIETGARCPSLHLAIKISDLTDIPVKSLSHRIMEAAQ